MKYFVFADCHGNYEALCNSLSVAGYDQSNSDHQLIGLGDYFGRAAQSNSDCVNIWKWLKSSEHANQPICVRGNHEDILLDAAHRRLLTDTDIYNGEHNTFASFAGCYPNQLKYDCGRQFEAAKIMFNCGFIEWLESLPYYHETEQFIFVHGFVPHKCWSGQRLPLDSPLLSSSVWKESAWAKTPNIIPWFGEQNPEGMGKTIVFGHWQTKQLNELFNRQDGAMYDMPFVDEQHHLIGLDYTTVFTHKVGVAVFEE